MASRRPRPHVLAIPFHSQGHITPLLNFTRELARKGVMITFVCPEAELSRITSEDSSEFQDLDFRFWSLPSIPFDRTTFVPSAGAEKIRKAFEPTMEKLLNDKRSGVRDGPTSILSDFFLNWTQEAADELQIPRYMFIASGAILARYMQGSLALFREGRFRPSETDGKLAQFDDLVCIPGVPPLLYLELPLSTRVDPVNYMNRCLKVWKAAGVLVNSFYELEEEVIKSFKRAEPPGYGLDKTKVPKIYPIGPLIASSANVPLVQELEDSGKQSLQWLDSQPPSSVLYIAFGSAARLSSGQINDLALALESSLQRFLWVLPKVKVSPAATQEEDLLPPGFSTRVGNRGCVVFGWVPQVQILAHPSTSVFLTHSGWNSSLESITMGVPMISWPQGAEQHLNCRYLVDELKVAYEIRRGLPSSVQQKDIERAIRLMMVEAEGEEITSRVKEFQKRAAAAVAQAGSRSWALEQVVNDLLLDMETARDESNNGLG